jgi:hypothetical protein
MSKSDKKNNHHSHNGQGNGKGDENKMAKGSAKIPIGSPIIQGVLPKPTTALLNAGLVDSPVPPAPPQALAKAKQHAKRHGKERVPGVCNAGFMDAPPLPAS